MIVSKMMLSCIARRLRTPYVVHGARALHTDRFYIGGNWRTPEASTTVELTNPATGEPLTTTLALGSLDDVNAAVSAACSASDAWRETSKQERLVYLERLATLYEARLPEMAQAISLEMGAPISLAKRAQAGAGLSHIRTFVKVLRDFEFEERLPLCAEHELLLYEPLGVCACITPWNWPMNQVTLKVCAALAAGNVVVLKPSEIAPLSSLLFAELIDAAGFPAGTFNLVNGEGATVGEALARHQDVDMVSFTGSTRGGVAVSKAAADGVKRVSLELGGKGANLIFADVGRDNLRKVVSRGVSAVMMNSGQSCNAPTRMIVEQRVYDETVEIAAERCAGLAVGSPDDEGAHLGPVASEAQFAKVQRLIATGIDEGASLVCGGSGRPKGIERGWFCRPTVFADVLPSMTIAREEIFGPVLSILCFRSEDEAVSIANDTAYGLTSYVQSGSAERVRRVVKKLKSGMVEVNGARRSPASPFGGVKASGNGREGGFLGLREFLEVKAVSGWPAHQ